MTSQGSPLTRLRRALASGDLSLALLAAAECPRLDLADSLRLVVLLAEAGDARFERAAARWHALAVQETGAIGAPESALVLALLQALPGPAAGVARASLAAWLHGRGLTRAAAALADRCAGAAGVSERAGR